MRTLIAVVIATLLWVACATPQILTVDKNVYPCGLPSGHYCQGDDHPRTCCDEYEACTGEPGCSVPDSCCYDGPPDVYRFGARPPHKKFVE